MEIYLIRHTTPDSDFSFGNCYGQSDIPLAKTFYTETHKLLAHVSVLYDAVYSSPMNRCFKLAQFIKALQPVIIDNRLLEMNFGDWEMKKWDEINQQVVNEWMKDFVNVRVPNGENFFDLNTRVREFISDLKENNYKNVAIVTHAGVIRSIVCQTLEIPLYNAFKIPIDYGSMTKISMDEKSCLKSIGCINKIG